MTSTSTPRLYLFDRGAFFDRGEYFKRGMLPFMYNPPQPFAGLS